MLAEPTVDGQIATAVLHGLARTERNRNPEGDMFPIAELSMTTAFYNAHNPKLSGAT
jgi:hypothetical protein